MTKRSPNARRTASGLTHAEIRDAATGTHKHCTRCGQFKVLGDFAKDPRGFRGRASSCRSCVTTWRHEYLRRPHVRRYTRLKLIKRNYGEAAMHLEERRLNGDGCDACGSTLRTEIDHCHNGGGPRGLLCRLCNRALGFARDDPAILRALADYLG